jgi:dethiobiotin synthetase
MVPLNKKKLVLHLIKKLKAKVVIVSKNELGSINHSLLTAAVLKKEKVDVAGWVFNEDFMNYDGEIASWSGYPIIATLKHLPEISKESIKAAAEKMKPELQKFL